MKKYLCLVLILLNLYLPVFMAPKAEAATVSTSFYTNVYNDWERTWWWALSAFAYRGGITTTVTKVVNFVLPGGATASNHSNLNPGESIVLSQNDSYASWFQTGGWNDSPPSDGQWYLGGMSPSKSDFDSTYFLESPAYDHAWVNIESSNPSVLECSPGWGCTAKNPGYAQITVHFPQAARASGHRFLNGQNFGFGLINISAVAYRNGQGQKSYDTVSVPYSFPAIYYGVTVNALPNTNQVVSCLPPTNISKKAATLNWSYYDAEGDAQADYHIQLSRNSDFTDIVYKTANSWGGSGMTSSGGSVTIPDDTLLPQTSYYSRIQVYNSVNSWGNSWLDCGANLKTLSIPPHITGEGSCDYGGESATINWVNAPGYNNTYLRIVDTTLYGKVASQYSTYSDYFKTLWNDNVEGTTYDFETIPEHKYVWWIHTKDTSISTGSFPENWSIATVSGDFTCSATAGVCGTIRNTCASPDLAQGMATTSTQYIWSCPSSDPGSPATNCSMNINPPVDDGNSSTTPPGGNTPPGGGTGTDCSGVPCTEISITKTPAVTLNKNGSCTIDWQISNLPTGASCSLNGWGVNDTDSVNTINPINSPTGSKTITKLKSNQKYTITCSGGTINPVVSKSVICRVNPDVKEK